MVRLERAVQAMHIDAHRCGEWFELDSEQVASAMAVSTVFYRDVEWKPADTRRTDFDGGAAWAKRLPICGVVPLHDTT